uniref:Putative viral integrase n=1 Tax=Prasiolopsis wulf-kochii TaxID=3239232 RepID=A0A097KK17_9CHLO|nr:putative viral integrase [Prasiolopsis sp. SAG 84.81]
MKRVYRTRRAKRGYDNKAAYIFANILNNCNRNATPNLVWVLNFTKLDIKGQLHSSHYWLIFIDHFARKVIYNKVYFIKHGKGCVFACKVIKALQQCIIQRQPNQEVLVHTDNGTEFVNKEYYSFVDKNTLLVGSTSSVGQPEHNSLTESAIKKN